MTVFKAFKNFTAVLTALAIILAAGTVFGIGYKVYNDRQESSYTLSKLGSSGEEVKSIQRKLNSLGYYKGSIDGIYGTETKKAVTSFQRN